MSTLYTQNLNGSGGIINARLKKYTEVQDVLSCKDELFLQQSTLEDRVEKYAEALESGNQAEKFAFGAMVTEGAKGVIESKKVMAQMEQWRGQHITRETLFMLIRNIADLLYQTFALDDESREKVADIVASIEAGALGLNTSDVTEADLFAEAFNSVPALELCEE